MLSGEINLNEGTLEYRLTMKDGLFYRILGEASGQEIDGEEHLFELMKQLVRAKREYDRVSAALDSVRETGYGMVSPDMSEMTLSEPEIVRQGGRFGVRLRASAPSLHMIRVDIQTEVSPIVGTEKQSEELVNHLLSEVRIQSDRHLGYGNFRKIIKRPRARGHEQQTDPNARGCARENSGIAEENHQRGQRRHDLYPALISETSFAARLLCLHIAPKPCIIVV